MEWDFLDKDPTPPGSDEVFTQGRLREKTYIDVTMKQPEQYLACKKARA